MAEVSNSGVCVCVFFFLSVAWGLRTLFNLLEENLSPCLTRLGGYAFFKSNIQWPSKMSNSFEELFSSCLPSPSLVFFF